MKVQGQSRREFIRLVGLGTASAVLPQFMGCSALRPTAKRPNIIIIFCDDLGYGDLGAFGHPTIRTPNVDCIAREGQKWTNFYAAASVCTPSRAALMTGRLPVRSGMCNDGEEHRVLSSDSKGGLPESEITLAEALKTREYATGCIGKWHLGHLPQYLPTRNGFDMYFGIPYSNDMDFVGPSGQGVIFNPKSEYWNIPLLRNEEIIERPVDQATITKRYTEEAVNFINAHKNKPFFLYLAHTFPHVPLFASSSFQGRSLRGLYGDVVEEIDWSVGEIIEALKRNKIAKNTLIVFSSDNGPWLPFNEMGGSAGLLRDGKGSTWEGGMREPTIFWWPGRIKPGVIMDIGCTMDLFTTACNLAGAKVPDDRIIDGIDLGPALFGKGQSPREIMFFYRGTKVYAVRKGPFKAHFITKPAYGSDLQETHHDPPLLFHLGHDPSEKYDIAEKHPDVIKAILSEVEKHRAALIPGENQLEKR